METQRIIENATRSTEHDRLKAELEELYTRVCDMEEDFKVTKERARELDTVKEELPGAQSTAQNLLETNEALRQDLLSHRKTKQLLEQKIQDMAVDHQRKLEEMSRVIEAQQRELQAVRDAKDLIMKKAETKVLEMAVELRAVKEAKELELKQAEQERLEMAKRLKAVAQVTQNTQGRGQSMNLVMEKDNEDSTRNILVSSRVCYSFMEKLALLTLIAQSNKEITIEIHSRIAAFLAGDNAYGSLASYNVANRLIRQTTIDTLYETVVLDAEHVPNFTSGVRVHGKYIPSGFKCTR